MAYRTRPGRVTSAERARLLAVCIIANNITRASPPTLWRVNYMNQGTASYSGQYLSRESCLRALSSFRGYTRAWLEQSDDQGRTWRTLAI